MLSTLLLLAVDLEEVIMVAAAGLVVLELVVDFR
jgi:hypothetical protein